MGNRLWVGTTGNLITGHVLDCNKTNIEQQLKRYDEQLYIKWNSRKLKGWGCWELRRRPEKKTVKEVVIFGGNTIVNLDYIENGFVSHLLDLPFLNYSLIEKVRKMDTWMKSYYGKNWVNTYESKLDENEVKTKQKATDEMRYNFKQMKTQIKDFREYILSGNDPYRLLDNWDKLGS